MQFIVRVVFKAYSGSRRPLRMLFGNALLRNDRQLQLLVASQFGYERALAVGVGNDRDGTKARRQCPLLVGEG